MGSLSIFSYQHVSSLLQRHSRNSSEVFWPIMFSGYRGNSAQPITSLCVKLGTETARRYVLWVEILPENSEERMKASDATGYNSAIDWLAGIELTHPRNRLSNSRGISPTGGSLETTRNSDIAQR